MKRLMLKKNLDQITVQDLTDAASVNRKTFYYHYHDIGDLLVSIYTITFQQALNREGFTPDNWKDQYDRLMKTIRRESRYLKKIYASSYAPYFRMKMEALVQEAMKGFILAAMDTYERKNQQELRLKENQISYIQQFYSYSFFSMLEQWFLSGMKEKEEEVILNLDLITYENMYRTFEQMDRRNRT